ncbi:MAG: ComF family protein [Candidatus Omnitrophota bacterium]
MNIIFYTSCLLCEKARAEYPLPICLKCQKSLDKEYMPRQISTAHITKILFCRQYKGLTANCVKQIKYNNNVIFINVFTGIMQNLFEKNPVFTASDFIIPVPLHKTRYLNRGFNQSDLIAKKLKTILQIPLCGHNLIKIKNTRSQTSLTKKERLENLKDSFRLKYPLEISKKTIILVDDVFTTGATLESCAIELAAAGAKKIFAFTLAKTP